MMEKKRKLSDNNPQGVPDGRVMPQALDLENAILGGLLSGLSAAGVVETLTPESFYSRENGIIFAAVMELFDAGKPVDMLTVIEQLRHTGNLEDAGGASRIAELSGLRDVYNTEYYVRIVSQKHLARRLIVLSAEIQARAFDETADVSDILEFVESKFTEISISSVNHESVDLGVSVRRALKKALEIQKERESGKTPAIPTGIKSLDRVLYGGWRSPDLIVLGGRPSMGKTQMAVHFAKSAAEAGREVLFVSLEMTGTQLANRLLLEDEMISAYNLMSGQMSAEEWNAVNRRSAEIWNMKIRIADDTGSRRLSSICSEARRLKRKGNLDMIIVDYLGFIVCDGRKFERRQIEIAHITGTLKNLAKELDVPVILLCQLNRPEKGKTVYEPQLHDLRESGDIEQDADTVLFVHRPTYYDMDKYAEWEGRGKIIVGKYREGERNRSVVFCHDANFKKIWGDENFAKRISSNSLRDYHSEPEAEMPF
jgi:replicative DNA helicase